MNITSTSSSPRLFPSCRVAGMTADLPSPHRHVCLLARSQLSAFNSCWHVPFHLVFGRPLFRFHGISVFTTFLIMCSLSLLITCPYQFNRISVIILKASAAAVVSRMCSFLVLFLRVTPHIHRSILNLKSISTQR